jgi:hypothetical protein
MVRLLSAKVLIRSLRARLIFTEVPVSAGLCGRVPVSRSSTLWQSARQANWHFVPGLTASPKTPEICGIDVSTSTVAGLRQSLARIPDSRCQNRDLSSDAGADRLRSRPSLGHDCGYFADQRAQPERRANPAALSSSLELLDLFVGDPVDLVDLGACVVNELGNLVNDGRHALVEVGLIHHRQRVSHIHAVHAVDHVTGVLWVETIC